MLVLVRGAKTALRRSCFSLPLFTELGWYYLGEKRGVRQRGR